MAVIKMGALVTEIAGSIGGTTFRRFRGSFVMYNKSVGGSMNKLLTNQRLQYLAWLSKQYNLLSTSDRETWATETVKYTFPDKFGNSRILSPKDFFVKMNGNLSVIPEYYPSADDFRSQLCDYSVVSFICSLDKEEAIITIIIDNIENYFLFQCDVKQRRPYSFVFNRRKITAINRDDGNFTFNIWNALLIQFPNLKVNDWVVLYHQNMSLDGLRGPKGYIIAKIDT